jgi:hypothetical protein
MPLRSSDSSGPTRLPLTSSATPSPWSAQASNVKLPAPTPVIGSALSISPAALGVHHDPGAPQLL